MVSTLFELRYQRTITCGEEVTIGAVSASTGISPLRLRQIESGKPQTLLPQELRKLASFFEVSLDEMMQSLEESQRRPRRLRSNGRRKSRT
jgi:transcriptional regulator with XRE-family HTH domain